MLSRISRIAITQARTLLRPPINKPFRGIYRKDGESVCEGELLVCQGKPNYVSGLNVYHEHDRGQSLLKASCDGRVRITTEWLEKAGEGEFDPGLSRRPKLTFNVLPDPPSNTFKLTTLV